VQPLLAGLRPVRGDEHHRESGMRLGERARHLEAALRTEAHVEQDAVGGKSCHRVERARTVGLADDLMATRHQQHPRDAPEHRLVVDDHQAERAQHGHVHYGRHGQPGLRYRRCVIYATRGCPETAASNARAASGVR
jgi:hypothetical protein